jgi:hypothetical protein
MVNILDYQGGGKSLRPPPAKLCAARRQDNQLSDDIASNTVKIPAAARRFF